MRVALVIPGFQSDENDWCIPAFTNLARELSASVDLDVFALRYPQRRDDYNIGRVKVHAIGAGAILGLRPFGISLLKLWSDFADVFRNEHTASPFAAVIGIWATEAGWLATRSAQELRIPSLVHLAGGEVVSSPYIQYGNRGQGRAGRMVQETLNRADLLTVPSDPVMRALYRMRGVSLSLIDARTKRWSLGVDTNMFTPTEKPRDSDRPFTFVTVGSLIRVKGHRLLIASFDRLRTALKHDFNARLRIVGSGPLRPTLEQLIKEYELEGYVTLEGDVPHEKLPLLFSECDAFLLGSFYEAQCMAVLEAMSCGLPWIAPLVGCIPDVARSDVGETPTGLIFDARKPSFVASAMRSMMELDPAERRRWGLHARERVLRGYELRRQTERLLALLSALET
ncbi:MAG TPA: glycosyltransferase family 4 protein [Chloroflexia bacterium]|nr:glycosyltransferase family 4 protein [Chloroflexia bacterium]